MTSSPDSKEYEQVIAPRPLSRLTYKILSVNIITLAVLAMSFSYISQTRENLIGNEIDNFETDARIYTTILNKSLRANDDIQQIGQVLSELNIHAEQQANLYAMDGQRVISNGAIPERKTYVEIHDKNLNMTARSPSFRISNS